MTMKTNPHPSKVPFIFKLTLLFIVSFLLTSASSKSDYQSDSSSKNDSENITFNAKGLHFETVLTNIFKGNFIDIPFDRDETTFVLLFNAYVTTYAKHCTSSLPVDKIELTRPECVKERVTTDGYGWEISRVCVEWIDVGIGLYAAPEMFNTKVILDNLQAGDAFRNMYKMMKQDNPIGIASSVLNNSQAADADMKALLKMNGCKSAGLMRFQDNLRLFALGKQPIPISGKAKAVVSYKNQNLTKLAEDLVFEHSKTWAMNRYQRGSITSVAEIKDSQGKLIEIRSKYVYQGFSGRSNGSVRITFTDGLPECLYFFDFPNACRTANRKIVAQYAGGNYQK
ncbi:hypothetical protein [Hwangdonia lutea]|uniref:Uncharacterized protein n=1 Tax=Hwangdonia lutea TaxID=3075823 RepID=A0AA97ENA3_9FLAO|nr:hypothetical protein [Hwangdonia sp. SCSIO 19198]WOD43609.1 hypothetical protein RNZ46_16615 [Hwangdonia sp. SCSIO 19198]